MSSDSPPTTREMVLEALGNDLLRCNCGGSCEGACTHPRLVASPGPDRSLEDRRKQITTLLVKARRCAETAEAEHLASLAAGDGGCYWNDHHQEFCQVCMALRDALPNSFDEPSEIAAIAYLLGDASACSKPDDALDALDSIGLHLSITCICD